MLKPWKRPENPIVFQFTHPGDEHGNYYKLKDTKIQFKLWNTQKNDATSSTHKRKYLCNKGAYIAKNKSIQDASLCFWGEWEPDSIAIPFESTDGNNDHLPKYCNIPFYFPIKEKYESSKSKLDKRICDLKNDLVKKVDSGYYYQNTDPFVYGTEFRYATICKPYETLNMKEGSVILFGSTKEYDGQEKFRVDTVFVVKEIKDIKDYKKDKSSVHYNASLKFIDDNDGYDHKMFIGATPENSVNGMFSFIPASVDSGDQKPRKKMLVIDSDFKYYDDVLNTVNWQGHVVCEDGVKEFWDSLLDYTFDKGYVPAVRIDMPPIFDSIDDLSNWISSV